MTAKELIESLPERFIATRAGNTNAIVHLDIKGDQGGQYTVSINHGSCRVQQGLLGQATCSIKADDKTYAKLESGKIAPAMALFLGKIKVSNVDQLLEFTKMFERIKA